MKKLRVKMWRDLWSMKWRALAIVTTMASGVAVYGGIYMGVGSLYWTRDSVYEQLHFADLEVRFMPEDVNNLPDLSGLKGVELVEKRLVLPGVIKRPGNGSLMAIMTFLETPSPAIHSFQFLQGRPFRADELKSVVIERSLSEYHGFKVGDSLDVKVGERKYSSQITGVAISPEFFVSTSNPEYFIPERGSLGVVFGNLDRVSDSLGFTIINDLLFRFAPGANPAAVKQDVLDRLGKLGIDQVIPEERHFSHKFIQTELGALKFFVPAMVGILLLLAFVITFINFNRMVAAERPEIGALMALGYGRRTLLWSYLEAGAVLGLIGSLLGAATSFWMRDLFTNMCAKAIGMPLVRMSTDGVLLLKGVSYGVLVALVSAAIPVFRLLRLPPQRVIRESPAGPQGQWATLKWISPALTALPPSYRYGVRNLLRNTGRTLATLASIALALGVVIAYRMCAGSIDETLRRRYENDRWQLAVDFLYPVFLDDIEGMKKIHGVQQVEPLVRRYVELEKDGRFEDSTLVGVNPESSMARIYFELAEGQVPRSGDNRDMIVSVGVAKKLEVGVGDAVNIHVLGQVYPFRVVGLSSDIVLGISVVPFSCAQELCQLPEKGSGMYLGTDAPPDRLAEELYQKEFVGRVVKKSALLGQIRNIISVMITVLDVGAGISIFVALMFILTSINLSILETESEFATLKAIGYDHPAISRVVLTEASAYAIGATLLSIPLAMIISTYLNHRMGQAWFHVESFFFPSEFAKVLLPALLLIPAGAFPGLRHLFHLDVSRAIRVRTIE